MDVRNSLFQTRTTETSGSPLVSRGDGGAGAPAYQRQTDMFLALARGAGNPEHSIAVESISARLQPVQRLEERFLDETEGETADILRSRKVTDAAEEEAA